MSEETPKFPSIKPTSRNWTAGDFPVKTFRAQNGAELRILYGNQIAEKRLQLTYANLTDEEAELFFDHYLAMKGIMIQFPLNDDARIGWAGKQSTIGAGAYNLEWRYAQAPEMTSVYKGRSTISVSLVAVSR